jgi:hypothetical protein
MRIVHDASLGRIRDAPRFYLIGRALYRLEGWKIGWMFQDSGMVTHVHTARVAGREGFDYTEIPLTLIVGGKRRNPYANGSWTYPDAHLPPAVFPPV